MINKKKEGGFYASKVRLFLNEYDGIPLEEFCKAEKVSYNKMLNCLGRTNHQYHPVGKPKSDKPVKAVEPDRPLLPSLELKELVIDKPGEQEPAKEDLSRLTLIKPQAAKVLRVIENISISINDRIGVSIGKCDVCASVIVDLGNTSRANFIATPAMVMSTSSCHVTSADSESITSTTMEKSSRKRSCMHTGSLIPSFWMRASMCTTSLGPVSFTCSRVSSGRKKMSISMRKMAKKSLVKSSQTQCDFVSII